MLPPLPVLSPGGIRRVSLAMHAEFFAGGSWGTDLVWCLWFFLTTFGSACFIVSAFGSSPSSNSGLLVLAKNVFSCFGVAICVGSRAPIDASGLDFPGLIRHHAGSMHLQLQMSLLALESCPVAMPRCSLVLVPLVDGVQSSQH